MKTPKIKGYSYKQRTNTDYVRVVAEIPVADAKRLDDWGISQGMPSRTAAIRHLIKNIVGTKKASEPTNQSRSDASNDQ